MKLNFKKSAGVVLIAALLTSGYLWYFEPDSFKKVSTFANELVSSKANADMPSDSVETAESNFTAFLNNLGGQGHYKDEYTALNLIADRNRDTYKSFVSSFPTTATEASLVSFEPSIKGASCLQCSFNAVVEFGIGLDSWAGKVRNHYLVRFDENVKITSIQKII
jgi:hypothetical protein